MAGEDATIGAKVDLDFEASKQATDGMVAHAKRAIESLAGLTKLPGEDPAAIGLNEFARRAGAEQQTHLAEVDIKFNLGELSAADKSRLDQQIQRVFKESVHAVTGTGYTPGPGGGRVGSTKPTPEALGIFHETRKPVFEGPRVPGTSGVTVDQVQEAKDARTEAKKFLAFLQARNRLDHVLLVDEEDSVSIAGETNAHLRRYAIAVAARTTEFLRAGEGGIAGLAQRQADSTIFEKEMDSRVRSHVAEDQYTDPEYATRQGNSAALERLTALESQVAFERRLAESAEENLKLSTEEAQLRRVRITAEKAAAGDFTAHPERGQAIATGEAQAAVNARQMEAQQRSAELAIYQGKGGQAALAAEASGVMDQRLTVLKRSLEEEKQYGVYLTANSKEVAEEAILRKQNTTDLERLITHEKASDSVAAQALREAEVSVVLDKEINKEKQEALIRAAKGGIEGIARERARAEVYDRELSSRVRSRVAEAQYADPESAKRDGNSAAVERLTALETQVAFEKRLAQFAEENVKLSAEEVQTRQVRLAAERRQASDFSAHPERGRSIADDEAQSAVNARLNQARQREAESAIYGGAGGQAVLEAETSGLMAEKLTLLQRGLEEQKQYAVYLGANGAELAKEAVLRQQNTIDLERLIAHERAGDSLAAQSLREAEVGVALDKEINKEKKDALVRQAKGGIEGLAEERAKKELSDRELASRARSRVASDNSDPEYATRQGNSAAAERVAALETQVAFERRLAESAGENAKLSAEETQLRRVRVAEEQVAATDFTAHPERGKAIATGEAQAGINERLMQAQKRSAESQLYGGAGGQAALEAEAGGVLAEKLTALKRSLEEQQQYSAYLVANGVELAKEAVLRKQNTVELERLVAEERGGDSASARALREAEVGVILEKERNKQKRDALVRAAEGGDSGIVRGRAASVAEQEVSTLQRRLIVAREALGFEVADADLRRGRVSLSARVNIAEEELRKSIQREASEQRGDVKGKAGLFQRLYARSKGTEATEAPTAASFLGSRALTTAGFALSGAVLYGGVTKIKEMVTSAEDLEKIMNQVRQQFDGLGKGEQFAGFSTSMLKIARDTGSTAAEVATVGFQLQGAFGGDTQRAIKETQSAFEAVRVTGLETKEVIDAFTALTENFASAGVTIEQVTDKALGLQERFGVLAKETISFSADLSPVAAEMGFTVQQLEALGAVAQKYTAKSGAGLAESYGRILPAIQKNSVAIANVFSAVPDLAPDLDKLNESFRTNDIASVFELLLKDYTKLDQGNKNYVASLLGGRRETAALIPVLANGGEALKEFNNAQLDAGKLAQYNADIQETLSQKVQRLSEDLRQLGVAAFEGGLGDILKDAASVLDEMVLSVKAVGGGMEHLNEMSGGAFADLVKLMVGLYGARAGVRVLATGSQAIGGAAAGTGLGQSAIGSTLGQKFAKWRGWEDSPESVEKGAKGITGASAAEKVLASERLSSVKVTDSLVAAEAALIEKRAENVAATESDAVATVSSSEAKVLETDAILASSAAALADAEAEALQAQATSASTAASLANIGVAGAGTKAMTGATGFLGVAGKGLLPGLAATGAAEAGAGVGLAAAAGLAVATAEIGVLVVGYHLLSKAATEADDRISKIREKYSTNGRRSDTQLDAEFSALGHDVVGARTASEFEGLVQTAVAGRLSTTGTRTVTDGGSALGGPGQRRTITEERQIYNAADVADVLKKNAYAQGSWMDRAKFNAQNRFGGILGGVLSGGKVVEDTAKIDDAQKELRQRQIDSIKAFRDNKPQFDAAVGNEARRTGKDADLIRKNLEDGLDRLLAAPESDRDAPFEQWNTIVNGLIPAANREMDRQAKEKADETYKSMKIFRTASESEAAYQSGAITLGELRANLKAGIDQGNAQGAGSSPDQAKRDDFADLIKQYKETETEGLIGEAESLIKFNKLQGGDKGTGQFELDHYTKLLATGVLSPQDQSKYTDAAVGALQQVREDSIKNAPTVAEQGRLSRQGISATPQVREALILQTLGRDPAFQDYLQSALAGDSVAIEAATRKIAKLVVGGMSVSDATKQVLGELREAVKPRAKNTVNIGIGGAIGENPANAAKYGLLDKALGAGTPEVALPDLDNLFAPDTQDTAANRAAGDRAVRGARAHGNAIALAKIAKEQAQADAAGAVGPLAVGQAMAELINADQAMTDALEARVQGHSALIVAQSHGDPLVAANEALTTAQRALAGANENNGDELLAAVINAQYSVDQVVEQKAQGHAALLLAQANNDPVLAALQSLEKAQRALGSANDSNREQLTADLINTQHGAARAQQDRLDAQDSVQLALKRYHGDEIGVIQDQLNAAKRRRNNADALGLTPEEKAQLDGQIIDLQGSLRDTTLGNRREIIDYQLQMGEITKGQAIAFMQGLLQTKDLNDNQTRDLNLAIKNLRSELGADTQFNLPSRLGLPTLYEVRRLSQTPRGSSGYTDNRVVSVTVNATTGASAQDIANAVTQVVGQPNRTGGRVGVY